MQQTLPHRDWIPTTAAAASDPPPPRASAAAEGGHFGDINSEDLKKILSENAVVVLARTGCFMCHVLRLLLRGHGVDPTVLDVDDGSEGHVSGELEKIAAVKPDFPAVFVGGELLGGLKDVMGEHISGELVPRLRKARALWL